MKRATLTTYSTSGPAEPADLTDRLLAGEEGKSSLPPKKRQRSRPGARHEPSTAALQATEPETSEARATDSLQSALAKAEAAAEALRQAGREAPARYDVALRYRLDALAHHLQQVRDFVASLIAR